MGPVGIPRIFWSEVPPDARLSVEEIEERNWGILVDVNEWARYLAVEDSTMAHGYSSKEKAEEACQRLREVIKSRRSQGVPRMNWTQAIGKRGLRIYVRQYGRSYGITANLEGQEYLLFHDDCPTGPHEFTYSSYELAVLVCAALSDEIESARSGQAAVLVGRVEKKSSVVEETPSPEELYTLDPSDPLDGELINLLEKSEEKEEGERRQRFFSAVRELVGRASQEGTCDCPSGQCVQLEKVCIEDVVGMIKWYEDRGRRVRPDIEGAANRAFQAFNRLQELRAAKVRSR